MRCGAHAEVVFGAGNIEFVEESTRHRVVIVLTGMKDVFADGIGVFLLDNMRDGCCFNKLWPRPDDG